MRKVFIFSTILIVVVFAVSQVSLAQDDIDLKLNQWAKPPANEASKKTLEDAVTPILDMFGFLSGGGLANTADIHAPMGFDVGLRVTAMQVSDDMTPPFPQLSPDLQGGPLQGENVIPVPVLHVGVGLLGSLEAMGRFMTVPIGEEGSGDGNLSLIGIGAKLGILQNFALPKVAFVAAYHYLDMPENADFPNVNNISAALVVSKGFPIISFYGALGLDRSTLQLEGLPDDFPDSYNTTNFRGLAGIKVNPIPLLFINLDYNFGAVEGLSAGAGISIR